MIKILKIKGSWAEVLDDCRATVKKEMTGKTPSGPWIKKILIAEHDPIRDVEVKWEAPALPYWVAMHLKTHTWRSRTNSQRNDRQTEYDRTAARQDAPVDFIGDTNAQHLIDTSRKRLCYQASPETRKTWEDLKARLAFTDGMLELSNVMVPNCVYRCGCPEMASCGWYSHVLESLPDMASTDIQKRYDAYNAEFWADRGDADE